MPSFNQIFSDGQLFRSKQLNKMMEEQNVMLNGLVFTGKFTEFCTRFHGKMPGFLQMFPTEPIHWHANVFCQPKPTGIHSFYQLLYGMCPVNVPNKTHWARHFAGHFRPSFSPFFGYQMVGKLFLQLPTAPPWIGWEYEWGPIAPVIAPTQFTTG